MKARIAVCAFALLTVMASSVSAQCPDVQPSTTPPAAPQASTLLPQRIRVAEKVIEPSLCGRVTPIYPAEAKAAHISGTVVLHVIIARDGSILNIDYVSGHPLLINAAMDAVKQWRYKPTLLNGQPVELDTTISVVFTLDGEKPTATDQGTQANVAEKPIDPQLRVEILHLLDVMHMKDRMTSSGRTMFDSMRPSLVQSLPPTPNRGKIVDSYVQKAVALYGTDWFMERLVDVYAKYFTNEDVIGMTQFYESPAGQHYNAAFQQLLADISGMAQKMALVRMSSIFSELCKEYPELQGDAEFCPQENKDDKSPLIEPSAAPERNFAEVLDGK